VDIHPGRPDGHPAYGLDSASIHRDEKLAMIAEVKQEIVTLESEGAAT